MNLRALPRVLLLCPALLAFQDPTPSPATQPAAQAPVGGGETQRTLEESLRLAQPGPEHAWLAQLVGEHEVVLRSRARASDAWAERKGTCTASKLLGGRYVQLAMRFPASGPEAEGFEVLQVLGHDRLRRAYTSSWRDTLTTWDVVSSGGMTEPGLVRFQGVSADPQFVDGRVFRMDLAVPGSGAPSLRVFTGTAGAEEELVQLEFRRA